MATCIGAVVNFSLWLVATGLARAVSNAVLVNEKSGQTEVRYLQWVASGANAAWQLQATRQVAIHARTSSSVTHATLPMQMGLLKTKKRFETGHTTLLQMRLFKTDKWFADAMDVPRVASGAHSQGPTVRRIGKLTSWASVPFVRSDAVWSWWRMRLCNSLEHICRAPCAAHVVVAEAVQIPLVGWLLPRSMGGEGILP